MSKRVLIAPNAFKGSLSAIEVAKSIKSSFVSLNLDFKCELAPIADGGDGTVDILNFYFKNSKFVNSKVYDPLMREISSKWLLLNPEIGVVEMAKASGLSLLKPSELNPMWASTYGTGQLIVSALDRGCKKIILTLGGSATVDAGCGILSALGVRIYDKDKKIVKPGGGFLNYIDSLDMRHLDKRILNTDFHVLCDVKIPLIGNKGTVLNFSLQKGAKEGEMILMENGMRNFANVVKKQTGISYENEPMLGAAGGVSFSMKALLKAVLHSGFLYIASMISLDEKIKSADLIITGEGKLDMQTLMGKAILELTHLAKRYGKTVFAVCGDYDRNINWASNNIDYVIKVKPDEVSQAESIKNVKRFIESAIKNEFELFKKC